VEKTESKILITGAEGMLGMALKKAAEGRFQIESTDFKDLDITKKEKVFEKFQQLKPQTVIHCAAYTDVDGCEKRPEVAYEVNVRGAKNIAEAVKSAGAVLIFVSTDYVFDGNKKSPYTEEDQTNPLGVYGRTKLEAEKVIRQLLNRHLSIRSSFLFGKGKKGFIEAILEQARLNKSAKVVSDKFGSPTYVKDLAGAVISLCDFVEEKKLVFAENNILNITNAGSCSWIEYAQKVLEFSGIKGVTLFPMRLADYPFKAQRPPYSVLDNSKFISLTGQALRPWQEALKEYLQCSKN